jgi:sucrose-6-phosphate hydrolase SacC (GH32 family)
MTWTKQGIVMSPDQASWEKSEVSPNSILVENGVFEMYYHGGGYPGPGGVRLGNALIGRATSTDGVTWTKDGAPVLDLGPAGSFDSDQVAEPRVLALASGYRMYYTGRKAGTTTNALGVATSSDGIAWTKSPQNPILDAATWGNFWGGAFFHEGNAWYLWRAVQSGNASSLHFMTSADGLAWTESGAVLAQNTDANAADYGLVGDSVSGYRTGTTYRIMYTGFNSNLFGTQGRFEGICMASIPSPCP